MQSNNLKLKIIGIGYLLIFTFSTQSYADVLMAKADSLFDQRYAVFDKKNILADKTNISQSIAQYKQILDTSADEKEKHEAAWKILRAYFLKGLFTTTDKDQKLKIFSEAVSIGEKLIIEFPESVDVNCWFGIVLGYMGEIDSKIHAARNGIPGRVKKIAEKVITLDKNYLNAGGYRMYGRLHYVVPFVPVAMNWPSKEKAVDYLEKACKIAPDDFFNELYLAEALLERKQKDRAVQILESIVNAKEIHHDIAVDLFLKKKAKLVLDKVSPSK